MILDFCAICGSKEDLHQHHFVPRSQGGVDDETNLLTVCYKHHSMIHGLKSTTWSELKKLQKIGIREARKKRKFLGRIPRTQNLSQTQIDSILTDIRKTRNPLRNKVIFLLSVAGLRAEEITLITWEMLLEEGSIKNVLEIPERGQINLNDGLILELTKLLDEVKIENKFSEKDCVVTTQRANKTSAQAITNMFCDWCAKYENSNGIK
jgi:hypothetical protein